MHSKSNNIEIEIMIGNETDGIIDELFAWIDSGYTSALLS